MRAVKKKAGKAAMPASGRQRSAGRIGASRNAASARKTAIERIGALIDELTADIPMEVWRKLPRDLSHNHDHYLYGTPKKR